MASGSSVLRVRTINRRTGAIGRRSYNLQAQRFSRGQAVAGRRRRW